MTESAAATKLQTAWRTRNARRRVADLARDVYVRYCDETTAADYFYNKRTGRSQWELPGFCAGVV